MKHVGRLCASTAVSLLLAACDSMPARPDVLALWLPDDDVKTFEAARRVRVTTCEAALLTRGRESRYQEWAVDSQHWAACRTAVKALGWKDSGAPVNWLFVDESPVNIESEVAEEVERRFIRFPDYQALFTYLTRHSLKEAQRRGLTGDEVHSVGRTLSFRDREGQIRSATVTSVSFDPNASSYTLDLEVDDAGVGFINARPNGFTGFITLNEAIYDFYVIAGGMQFVETRETPDLADHAPEFAGGAIFSATDAQRLTEATQKSYARFVQAHDSLPGSESSGGTVNEARPKLEACPRAYPFTGSQPSTVRILIAYAAADEPDVTVYPSDFDSTSMTMRLARDWDEVANTLARRASGIFARQSLGTRVQSAGAVGVNISEEFLDSTIGSRTGHENTLTLKMAMLAALAVEPSGEGERETLAIIRRDIAENPELAAQIDAFRHLLEDERYARKADLVAFITAPAKSANQEACGYSSSLRAQPGSAFLSVRLDCAWLNESFTHELGHLLGARHEKQDFYDCPPGEIDGECGLDSDDYDPRPPPFEVAAPRFNRAYVDKTRNTGTLMTSGSRSRTSDFLSVFSNSANLYRRVPYWSQVNSAAVDPIILSDGCCDDGAVVENYAANCVSQFFPDVPDEQQGPPAPGWDKGPKTPPVDGKPGLDARDLEATLEFEPNLPLRAGLIRDKDRTFMRNLELERPQEQFLGRVATQLSEQGINRFYVEGFTDTKLDSALNDRLAERRMITVSKQLCDLMPSASIGTASYGEKAALTGQRPETSEIRNRRVLISWRANGLTSGGKEIPVRTCEQFVRNDYAEFLKKDRSEVVTGRGVKLEFRKRQLAP